MIYVDPNYLNYTATLCGEVKNASYEMAGISNNQGVKLDVLDVGCGIGVDTLKIASILSPESRIVGVDFDTSMIEKAKERAVEKQIPNVFYYTQNSTELHYNNEFDIVRAERLFQHLPEPKRVFNKMVNAARQGGTVIIIDSVWASLRCTLFTDEENNKIAEAYSQTLTTEVNLPILKELYEQAGLENITSKTIGVKLDYPDYARASKIDDLIPRVFDEDQCRELKTKMELGSKADIFAVIDIVLISGSKRKE